MILVNGEETDHISVNDRGFQYGDGVFETIAVLDGKPAFLEQHLARLNAGCLRLKIPVIDRNLLINEIYKVCKDAPKAVLKLIITRGIGGRGYRQPDSIVQGRVVSLHAHPDYPKYLYTKGITARFCNTRLGLNPALAGIKHLNRLDQILARSEWDDPEIQEGIMLDLKGHVIEGTSTNLFYIKNETIHTSTLELSGVAGVVRGVLKDLISRHNFPFLELDFTKEDLLAADEAFVCNSIIGIWPIRKLENTGFTVGKVTKALTALLAEFSEQTLSYAP